MVDRYVYAARLAASGLYRFGDVWIALAEGSAFEYYESGSGHEAGQALHRLSDRLRERRGVQSG